MEKSGFIQYNLCQNCILFFENCIKKYTEKTGLLSKKLYKSDFDLLLEEGTFVEKSDES